MSTPIISQVKHTSAGVTKEGQVALDVEMHEHAQIRFLLDPKTIPDLCASLLFARREALQNQPEVKP